MEPAELPPAVVVSGSDEGAGYVIGEAGEAGAATAESDVTPSEPEDRIEKVDRAILENPPAYFDERTDDEANIADVAEPSSEPDPVLCGALIGDASRVAALLALGCSWKGRTWRRRGAMHLAARCGSVAMIRVLMANGCDADVAGDLYGHTSLHLAARAGHLAAAQVLADADRCLVDAVNRFGDGPLHLAVRHGHCDVAAFLLSCGASAVATNKVGDSSLELAAGPCMLPSAMSRVVVDGVLREAEADAAVLTRALVQAAWAGKTDVGLVLLHAGARHDVAVDQDFASAMEAAVFGLDPTGFVLTLLLAGAHCGPFPPLAPPYERVDAPLNALARRGRTEDLPAMTVLLAAGADVNYRDATQVGQHFTPLENAAALGRSVAMVNKLIGHGADVNLVGGAQRRTVLHWAAEDMRPPICRALLEAGADASVADGNRKTPLQVAERASRTSQRIAAFRHAPVSLADAETTVALFKAFCR